MITHPYTDCPQCGWQHEVGECPFAPPPPGPAPGSDPVEECWRKNWADIILNEDGTVNLDQVKKELHDYSLVMGCATEAFCLVTGGVLSKPNSAPEWVEHFAEEHYRQQFAPEDQNTDYTTGG